MIEQISQLQGHIHRLEEEIERQVPFEEAAELLMAVPGLGNVGSLDDLGRDRRHHPISQCQAVCQLLSAGTGSQRQWRIPSP
jgi:transposase